MVKINSKLHFTGKTGYYVQTKPLHGSQKSKWIDDNTLEVKQEVMINYELERLILSFSGQVKVIRPAKLVQSIRNKLAEAITMDGK